MVEESQRSYKFCGFHPTRKRVGFSQQIYSERNITLIDYLDFSKKIKTQIMITYFSSMKILKNTGKKIYNHLSNANWFINDFLVYRINVTMEESVTMLGDFLGDYFIRKCMWSTPSSVKTTAARLKKFYKSMAEHGKIEKKGYDYVCRDIKESMAYWQECCAEYNNPDFPF